MTDVYPPAVREDAVLDIPVPFARAGTWHAEVRARLVDDDGAWYLEVTYNTGVAENRIGTFPAGWVRRPSLADMRAWFPLVCSRRGLGRPGAVHAGACPRARIVP